VNAGALTEEQKSRRDKRKDRKEAKKGPKPTGMFAAQDVQAARVVRRNTPGSAQSPVHAPNCLSSCHPGGSPATTTPTTTTISTTKNPGLLLRLMLIIFIMKFPHPCAPLSCESYGSRCMPRLTVSMIDALLDAPWCGDEACLSRIDA